MKTRANLILGFSFLGLFYPSEEKLNQRLEKRLSQSTDKCLVYAEKLQNRFPKLAIPYYYIATTRLANVQEAEGIRNKYSNLSKALSAGYKFNRYANENTLQLVQWSDLKTNLEAETQSLILELLNENDSSRVKNLSVKLNRISSQEIMVEDFKQSVPSELQIQGFFNKQYFGMPTGNEMIEPYNETAEIELIRILNEARIEKGMEPLQRDSDLTRAARFHAYDMATQNYMSHQTYDSINGKLVEVGKTFKRIRTFYNKSFVNSENVAAGSSTALETYYQWFHSKGHYDNMFNPKSRFVGISVMYNPESSYQYYWAFCTAM